MQLIFRLYADGDSKTGTSPLGIKGVCGWLNERGFQTKRGGAFGVGPTHLILTNTAYVGRWKYNVRSAKTGEKKPESEIVEIAIPPIVDQQLFDRVQAKLAANNPKVTPPRVVNGPILLTGLAICGHRGGGMTQRTGTSRSGKLYSYYACASRAQNVLDALKDQLFSRERLAQLLSKLSERKAARSVAINARLVSLQAEVAECEQKLKRLYKSIADGIVELDDLLGEQIAALKADREKAKAALDRAKAQGAIGVTIDAEKIEAFSRLMTDMLADADTPVLKPYLRSIVGNVIVGEKSVRITGSKDVLASAVTGTYSARQNVRGFVPEWRAAASEANNIYLIEIER